jgi:hypothetical protein
LRLGLLPVLLFVPKRLLSPLLPGQRQGEPLCDNPKRYQKREPLL